MTIATAMLSIFASCEEAAPEPTPEPSKKFTAVLASRQAVFPEAREDKLLGIDFTVSGGPATELVVTENEGLVTKAVLAADGKSGHIDIAASADNWKTIPFAVKVSNGEGTDVEDFNITRAYITVLFDYALWVGEKPENVIQVGDHWEWKPGTNSYPKYASCSDR